VWSFRKGGGGSLSGKRGCIVLGTKNDGGSLGYERAVLNPVYSQVGARKRRMREGETQCQGAVSNSWDLLDRLTYANQLVVSQERRGRVML